MAVEGEIREMERRVGRGAQTWARWLCAYCLHGITEMDERGSVCRLRCKPNEAVEKRRAGGLVSGTMPQEEHRGCVEMCYPRPSGRGTTTKQGIKITWSRHDRAAAQQETSHQVIRGGRPFHRCSQGDCLFCFVLFFTMLGCGIVGMMKYGLYSTVIGSGLS